MDRRAKVDNRRKRLLVISISLIVLLMIGISCWAAHALRYDPTVYLRPIKIEKTLAANGITPEMVEHQLLNTQQMVATMAVKSFQQSFGIDKDTITLLSNSLVKINGSYGLRSANDNRYTRMLRRLCGRPAPELELSLSGGDSITVDYRIVRGEQTLTARQESFRANDLRWSIDSTMLAQLTPERRNEMMVSLALFPVCNAIGELTNPWVGRFQPHLEQIMKGGGVDFDFMNGASGAYQYEWLRTSADSLQRFFDACGGKYRAWGNMAIGIMYDQFGRNIEDSTILRHAQEAYSSAGRYDRRLSRALDYRIKWLNDYIASCRLTNSDDAFVETFLNDTIALPDSCRQLILVYNSRPDEVLCALRRYEREKGGPWHELSPMIHANVGRNGIAPWGEKREGDGRTPTGAYPMGTAFGYAKDIELRWPFLVVTPQHYWISDPADPHYNELTTIKPSTTDFEYLRRNDDAYKYAAVIEYNTHPVVKGNGSAIFFHIESGYNRGSAGCVTTSEPKVIEILQWLDPTRHPYMLIRTNSTHKHSARTTAN